MHIIGGSFVCPDAHRVFAVGKRQQGLQRQQQMMFKRC